MEDDIINPSEGTQIELRFEKIDIMTEIDKNYQYLKGVDERSRQREQNYLELQQVMENQTMIIDAQKNLIDTEIEMRRQKKETVNQATSFSSKSF